jgi:hypothetical protein
MEFNNAELVEEYATYEEKTTMILNGIKEIIIDCKSYLEGNSFYHHNTLHLFPELFPKQINLFWCGKQAISKICEIGFNAGHSTMLLLLGLDNKESSFEYTIFDIGHHSYTKPCVKYIESEFKNVKFEYIEGDSAVTMPQYISENRANANSYDVVHVDGGHTLECITSDMKNADILVKIGGIVIVDDTNVEYINDCVNGHISSGKYIELKVLKTVGYPHRIIRKCL